MDGRANGRTDGSTDGRTHIENRRSDYAAERSRCTTLFIKIQVPLCSLMSLMWIIN